MGNAFPFGLIIMMILFFQNIFANNLTVSEPALVARNAGGNYVFVKFNIGWENSWRVSSAPSNWDAAWVFVKYKVNNGEWLHATLNTTGSVAASGSIVAVSPDGKGAFIYRSSSGTGTVNFSGVKLRWNYGADGVTEHDNITVKVFGIEMAYVPTESFYLGSGGTEWGTFTDGMWTGGNGDEYYVTSENAITVAHSTGHLWSMVDSKNGTIDAGTIPAAYPKGYNHFYCMKYSISQEQYADFLNTLTYTQQSTRTAVAPNSSAETLAMTTLQADRSSIRIITSGVASTAPAVYGCDLNENGIFGESGDGQNISCNWLSWGDGIAYCDWAALRPMSELEFEKACRGPEEVYQYERPYGSDVVAHSLNIANAGTENENAIAATHVWSDSLGVFLWNDVINGATNINAGGAQWGLLDYPTRVGIYATDTSDRISSGATYYGILDMAGGVWERVVTAQNSYGRTFIGSHGDGVLADDGNKTGNNDWPGSNAVGAGFRGGAFNYDSDWARTSDRDLAAEVNDDRFEPSHTTDYNGEEIELGYRGTFGFRGVRTAQ
jgi:formylglycine-generating enzyme required for sulfatase activity